MKHFRTIDSTNSYALKHIEQLEDREVIISDLQTTGHGRFCRKWVSDNQGNLYLTFVLKPENCSHIANITQYLSVVLVRVLKKYAVSAIIKWPNDVLVDGAKICGILCEASILSGSDRGFALGLGVNLNMSENELSEISQAATSLNLLLERDIDKMEFVRVLCEEFFADYDNFINSGFSTIKFEYESYCNFLSNYIWVSDADGAKTKYLAKSINEDGTLAVIDNSGNENKLFSADIEPI